MNLKNKNDKLGKFLSDLNLNAVIKFETPL